MHFLVTSTITATMRKAKDNNSSAEQPESSRLELAPEGLDQTALEPDVIRWVARNIDKPNIVPSECPDPMAWTLLRNCRENPAFQCMFIEKIWTKLLPSRGQLDNEQGNEKIDGQETINAIDQIRAVSEEIKSESKPPKAELAEPIDYFDDFEAGGDE